MPVWIFSWGTCEWRQGTLLKIQYLTLNWLFLLIIRQTLHVKPYLLPPSIILNLPEIYTAGVRKTSILMRCKWSLRKDISSTQHILTVALCDSWRAIGCQYKATLSRFHLHSQTLNQMTYSCVITHHDWYKKYLAAHLNTKQHSARYSVARCRHLKKSYSFPL